MDLIDLKSKLARGHCTVARPRSRSSAPPLSGMRYRAKSRLHPDDPMMRIRRHHSRIGRCLPWLLLIAALNSSASVSPQGPLRSGSELDYPPYAIVDAQGRAGGLSVALLREALARAGREVTFQVAPWADLKDALAEGRLDVLPFVGRTPEREALFDFSQPYVTTTTAVIVRADGPALGRLEDLSDLEIAVMTGDIAEEYVSRQGLGRRVVRTRSYEDALRSLSVGRFDIVIAPRLVARHLIADHGLRNLRLAPLQLPATRQDWCFAVTEGNLPLARTLDAGLAEILADGTYDQIVARWIGQPPATGHGRLWMLGGAALGLAMIAITFWQMSKRASRTARADDPKA